MVECDYPMIFIGNADERYLTVGNRYMVVDKWTDLKNITFITVIDNGEQLSSYPIRLFESISSNRNRIIDSLIT